MTNNPDMQPTVTEAEVLAAITTFDGGLVRQNDERNARGYTTFYHPKDSMRAVLETFIATRAPSQETARSSRHDRVQKYLADEAAARERLATFPDAVRQRLTDWQSGQSEWFGHAVLEIVAEFIAFDDAARSADVGRANDDLFMDLSAAFGPVLKEAFPDTDPRFRYAVAVALSEKVQERAHWLTATTAERAE